MVARPATRGCRALAVIACSPVVFYLRSRLRRLFPFSNLTVFVPRARVDDAEEDATLIRLVEPVLHPGIGRKTISSPEHVLGPRIKPVG
jgi:hypothetical protein